MYREGNVATNKGEDMQSVWLSTIGLLFDAIGAVLVAIEVVYQYKGIKFVRPQISALEAIQENQIAEEHANFVAWHRRKASVMWFGLGFLLVGFALQAIANWV